MPHYTYERLSYEDNGFLVMETPTNPMHVTGIQIFRAGPLATNEGGIDMDSIRGLTESVLHRIPRYRQKLAWIPGENHAVWVDDPHFRLDYHMRHTSLPRPGTEGQLRRLAARIMEQPLDRSRPLWETWVVEGLEGERFAMISKIHHCMIDGAAGVDISQILQSPSPEREIGVAPRFIPRPHPSPDDLRSATRQRLATLPFRWMRNLVAFAREHDKPLAELSARVRATRDLLGWQLVRPSETPINGRVGPHRIVDWLTIPLQDVKAVRRALDCKVNDIVLTLVTNAIRDFMIRRQVRPEDLDFRVSAPVNVRRDEDSGRLGNRVSTWVVPLPLGEPDPLAQLAAIRETTLALKDSQQALGTEVVMSILDGLAIHPPASMASRSINTIVTNVPGPPFPLYLLGAEMLECYPQVPLLENMGMTLGVLSYNGRMCFGFIADYDRVPDLADFSSLMQRSFDRLAAAAGIAPQPVEETARVPTPKPPEPEVAPMVPVAEVLDQTVRH
jgi:WS/DGAT/MGAT family acyltransferase